MSRELFDPPFDMAPAPGSLEARIRQTYSELREDEAQIAKHDRKAARLRRKAELARVRVEQIYGRLVLAGYTREQIDAAIAEAKAMEDQP